MRRPAITIIPAGRSARGGIGLAATAAGAWLLSSASGGGPIPFEPLRVLVGLDPVLTGRPGHRLLCGRLSQLPCSLREPR